MGLDPQTHLVLAVAVCAALYAVLTGAIAIAFDPASFGRWISDGRVFYCAGKVAGGGGNPYNIQLIQICGREIGATELSAYVYPPWNLAAFIPLALLEPSIAAVVAHVVQAAAIVAITVFALYWTRGFGLPVRLFFALAPALAQATAMNIWLGQVNLPGAALLAGAATCLTLGRERMAAAALVLAAALKPGFALFFLLPAGAARWRALAWTLAGFGLLLGLSHLVAPPNAWADYSRSSMLAFVDRPLADWMRAGNHALAGPLSRLIESPQAVWGLHALALGLLAGVTAAAGFASWLLPRAERIGAMTALVACVAFLTGPYSWWAHSVSLWVAVAALAPAALRARCGWLVVVLAVGLLAPVRLNENPGGLLGMFPTALALAIWLTAIGFVMRDAQTPIRAALSQGQSIDAAKPAQLVSGHS